MRVFSFTPPGLPSLTALRPMAPRPRIRLMPFVMYVLCLLILPTCKTRQESTPAQNQPVASAPEPPAPVATDIPARPLKPEIRPYVPTDEPILATIAAELNAAERHGRDLLVYVGATWCEPCKRFHDAVVAGDLDETFPTLLLLEFDHDRDGEGLRQAGYSSRMIPLFVAPSADGRATDARHAGAVKGDGAVDFLVPRLKRVLEQRRRKVPL